MTAEHIGVLKEDGVKRAIVAFDNDEAGRGGAEQIVERLVGEGFEAKIILPGYKDWNEELMDLAEGGVEGADKEAEGRGSGAEDTKLRIKEQIEAAEVRKPEVEGRGFRVVKEGPKYVFGIGDISYRVVGVREVFVSNLRVNIRAERGGIKYLDNVDLYSARSRGVLSQHIGGLFEVEEKRIEKDLMMIVEYLEEERERRLSAEGVEGSKEMSEEDRELGMELLRSEDLFGRIVRDLEVLGYVGEELNKKLIYLAASSRKMEDPISVLILSQSAAGKSLLVETVRRLMPPEEVVSVTSLSDQALNYLPERGLLHKLLILGEAVHSEVVEHQLREMLSAHELSRLVALKDEKSGKMMTRRVSREVVVSALMSSTRNEVNAENASRCFLVNADETKEQTRKIHASQRKKYTLERYEERRKEVPEVIRRH